MLGLLLGSKAGLWGLALAIAMAAVGAGVLSYRHTLAQNRALAAARAVQARQLTQAQAINADNLTELQTLKADAARANAALASAEAALSARLRHQNLMDQEIARAPSSDDGPVAPVLRRALERLRGLVTPAAPDHQD